MIQLDKTAGKNIWFTSIYGLLPAVLTFVFWFFAAKIVGSQSLGMASSLVALSGILSTIVVLDMSLGMKRNLARSIITDDIASFTQIFSATIITISITLGIASIILLLLFPNLTELFGLDSQFVYLIIPMMVSQSFFIVLTETLISALKSRKLVIPHILGAMVRFPILVIFAMIFMADSLGTAIAFMSTFMVASLVYAIQVCKIIKKTDASIVQDFFRNAKESLSAGLSSWLPNILNILGYQLAVLTVLSTTGPSEAGRMYLILAIFVMSLFIVRSINLVMHPIVENLQDPIRRKRFLIYAIRVGYIFTIPLISLIIFYGDYLLQFIGIEYVSANLALSVILLSSPFVIISETIYFYYYGLGIHRKVLYLGLAGNVPRVLLYLLLSQDFGASGAAISYLVGSVIQLFYAAYLVKKEYFRLEARSYFSIVALCFGISGLMWFLGINLWIAIPVIVVSSLYYYVKTGILSQLLVENIIDAVLPANKATKANHLALKIMKIIKPK